jgi:RNA polymerase sigma-70 factor (ECF subfamily)
VFARSGRSLPDRLTLSEKREKSWVSRNDAESQLRDTMKLVNRQPPLPAAEDRGSVPLRLVASSERAERPEPTDTELVEALCAKQAWAEVAVWRRYAALVHQVAHRALGSRHDAEDILQQVFFCLFTKIDTLQKPSALRSFVFSITVRTLKAELKRRRIRRWITLSETGDVPDASIPGVDPATVQLLRKFYRVLDRLGAEDRTIFVLRHIQEMTLEEVAEVTELSLATVKRRLQKSSLKVTQEFEGEVEQARLLETMRRGT